MFVLINVQSLKFKKVANAIEVISLVDYQTGIKLVNHHRGFWALQKRIFKQVKFIQESNKEPIVT